MNSQDAPTRGPGRRVTVPWLRSARAEGRRIVMLTAYDAPSARLADAAGVDVLLVGDSLGRNVLGLPNELPVTMDDMVRATQAVSRVTRRALVLADLPFGAYQADETEAVRNALRLVKDGGANGVKLEGVGPVLPVVERLSQVGVPVCGHLGYTPQSVNALGGARAMGKTKGEAQRILDQARELERAGVFAIVLELIPAPLAGTITHSLTIPTVGIGSGLDCDGQVQVWHDILGLTGGRAYRHVKRYVDLWPVIGDALAAYTLDVQAGAFPSEQHAISMDLDELSELDADEGLLSEIGREALDG